MQTLSAAALLFDGELSSSESEASTPTVSPSSKGRKKHSEKPKTSVATTQMRPKRGNKNVSSYAESDTDEEMDVPSNPVVTSGTKRKRPPPVEESPRKKMNITRERSYSAGTVQLNSSPVRAGKGLAMSLPTVPAILTNQMKARGSPTKRNRAFIRLDANGESPSGAVVGAYWWPAKLSESTNEKSVVYQLFGDDGKGESRKIVVDSLSDAHIQSIWNPAPMPRYTQSNFQDGDAVDKVRFRDALDQLIHDEVDDEDDDEEGLHSDEAYWDDDIIEHDKNANWRPPSPTEFIGCVGQPVLCKQRPEAKEFWPAKVVDYIPPTKPSMKPRFQVNFFDWKTAIVARDCFYTQYDDDEASFADCKMDRKKLSSWTERNSQLDTEDDDFDIDFTQLPAPQDPPPKPRFFINEMGIEEQFAYVIPFMERILTGNYSPSKSIIDRWMSGGTARAGITQNPVQGGHLAELEWHTFGLLVRKWALPNSNSSQSENSVRPRGSERYEGLNEREKGLFIVDVLLGEAVIQLLLLRAGKRTTLKILSDEDEAALHAVGLSLSREESTSVTVRTILETRQRLRKRLGLREEQDVVPTEGEGRRHKNRVTTI
ncbi:hypothetical protein FRB91_009574 [Serendipita sp. 411]|nr:hypothetical protein FRB91_009574 [Serendipita sp. 411]